MSTNWPEPRPRRRRGRRDNGLDATSYVKVRLVDPRVGEHLLEVLRDAQVAAYLDPVSSDDPYRLVEPPTSPPFEHLYVDARLRLQAQHVLDEDMSAQWPGPGDIEADFLSAPDQRAEWAAFGVPDPFDLDSRKIDALFADIVGHYDEPAPEATFQAAPPATGEPTVAPPDVDDVAADEPLPADEPEEVDVWRGVTSLGPAADDPLDHYDPPEPAPIKRPSRPAIVAILVLLAGVLTLFFPQFIGIGGTTAVVLGVVGITAGVGLLLLRLKEDPPEGEEDDGAVV